MIRTLQSSWFAALVGGLIYLVVTVVILSPSQFVPPPAPAPTDRSADDDPSWRFRNPELNQWLSQIKEQKESLALREQQMSELQNRLKSERQEIMSVTQAVAQLQMDFDRNVVRFKTQEVENVKHQAKLISTMSPAGAAAIVAEMSDDEVVRILFIMKTDVASLILDTMAKVGKDEAKRAATLTSRLHNILPISTNSTATAASP